MRHKSDKPRRHAKKKENCHPIPAGPQGFDPELLYVECGRCGAPVIWEPGRATSLLKQAGVDPMELDASCILVTDACPACGHSTEYTVKIFRISDRGPDGFMPPHGNA